MVMIEIIKAQQNRINTLIQEGKTMKAICNELNISNNTFYRRLSANTTSKKTNTKKPITKNVHKQNINSIADMFDEATQVVKSFTQN